MHRFVNGVGVDLASAVPIQLFRDMLDEIGQPCLVVRSHQSARSLPLRSGTHEGQVTGENASPMVRRDPGPLRSGRSSVIAGLQDIRKRNLKRTLLRLLALRRMRS